MTPRDDEREFTELWRRFVEDYRRQRAPEGLRCRVLAAVRAAAGAGAGAWPEALHAVEGDDRRRPAGATRREA